MGNYLEHMNELGENQAFSRRVGYIKYNFSKYLNLISTKSYVLEIGPGKGELLHILNDKHISNIDILDNDASILSYCKKNFKVKNVIKASTLTLNKYLKNKYDLIVLTQVFEHIPKSYYINWVTNLYRALKPGGKIIITVPNGANPLVGTERYGDLQHENIFTIYSFKELMTFANLKYSSYIVQGFEIPPSSPINILRIALQKILHTIFVLLMIINGGIYQTLLTPNITLVITKNIQ